MKRCGFAKAACRIKKKSLQKKYFRCATNPTLQAMWICQGHGHFFFVVVWFVLAGFLVGFIAHFWKVGGKKRNRDICDFLRKPFFSIDTYYIIYMNIWILFYHIRSSESVVFLFFFSVSVSVFFSSLDIISSERVVPWWILNNCM